MYIPAKRHSVYSIANEKPGKQSLTLKCNLGNNKHALVHQIQLK